VAGDFQIGPWLIKPSLNSIAQNGTSNRVEPKVMEVLVCLAEHAGEAVSKEKLLHTVWPETFVSDDVLKRSVSELRRVFGDDARESKVIETIPKRGYRLVAAVKPVNGHSPADVGHLQTLKTEAAQTRPAMPRFSTGLIAVGVVVVICGLLVAANVGGARDRLLGRSALPPIRSLAVLPLQNLSGDPSQDYFADGMTEELITQLSRLSSLRVISRTSVMRYKNANRPLPEIARELGVEGIVEGSVLRSADRVRITAQLIYAPQDKNAWAQSYERDLHDVLTLQSTVASTIADAIRVQMTPSEQAQLKVSRPVNLAAHEAYLQGQYHLQKAADAQFRKGKGTLNAMEARRAEEYFRLAIRQDPDYAPPYVGLSEAAGNGPYPAEWAPKAKPMLLKALQIDDSLAEAHRCLAMALRCEWDWKGAEKENLRAIQLEPSNADAHGDYANLLSDAEGRVGEATREYEVAQRLDPKNDRMADAFYEMRQYDRAAELYKSQSQVRPSDFSPHMQLANIYALTGRHGEAISEWQKMATVLEYKEMAEAIGRAYKAAGYENALRVFAKQLEGYSRKAYIPPWFIASLYEYMGDKDQAFAWLEKAYKLHDGTDTLFDPQWDPLRSDPRFKDLMRRVGLPQ
jgi:TolB-like protein/DNA-binding winged helix-turn-helix (wHTH) protein/Tfp pilus assembly protein PilF